MRALSKHAGTALVAVAFAAVALAEGGAGTQLLAALTVAIWWIVIIALVARLWPSSGFPGVAVLAGLCLGGLAALTPASMLWAGDAGRAFADTLLPAAYLGLFVLVLLLSRPGNARVWLAGLAAGMVAVALVALASRVAPGLLGGQERELASALPQSLGRLAYPIGYWNALAGLMASAVVLLGWLAAHGSGVASRSIAVATMPLPLLVIYLTQSRGGAAAAVVGYLALVIAVSDRNRARIVLSAAVGAAGGAALVLLAASREAFRSPVANPDLGTAGLEMALAAGAVVAAAFLCARWLDDRVSAARLPRLPISPRALALALAVVLAGAGTLVLSSGAIDEFSDPEGFIDQPDDRTSLRGSGRSQYWSTAVDAWVENPVGGVGAGNYELYWNSGNPIPVVVEHAHSVYLETLAELGPAGLGLLLGFLGLGAAAGIARRRRSRGGEVAAGLALLASGSLVAALEWSWDIPAVFAPVVISVALMTGSATARPEWPRGVDEREPRSLRDRLGMAPPPRERFGLGIATLLAGLGCIWIAGVVLLSSVQLSQSRAAVDRGDLDEAANNASFAESVQPWSSEASLQLAQVEELRRRLPEAAAAAEEAISKSPDDWHGWYVAARIAHRAGDEAAARDALARAAELSPLPLPEPLPEPAPRVGIDDGGG